MENGGVFLLIIIGFFFVLWLVGGGPHKSIYSDGIFITPVTNVGQDQQAYGPKLTINKSVSVGGATLNASSSVPSTVSSYEGSIVLQRSTQTTPTNPNQEYLEFVITSNATSAIDLNGWKFVSASTGNSASIANSSVQLAPGQTVLIVTSFPSTSGDDTMQLVDENGKLVATVTY